MTNGANVNYRVEKKRWYARRPCRDSRVRQSRTPLIFALRMRERPIHPERLDCGRRKNALLVAGVMNTQRYNAPRFNPRDRADGKDSSAASVHESRSSSLIQLRGREAILRRFPLQCEVSAISRWSQATGYASLGMTAKWKATSQGAAV